MKKLSMLFQLLIFNMPFILIILGIGSIVYASFLFSTITGFLILGIGLIIIAYLLSTYEIGGITHD